MATKGFAWRGAVVEGQIRREGLVVPQFVHFVVDKSNAIEIESREGAVEELGLVADGEVEVGRREVEELLHHLELPLDGPEGEQEDLVAVLVAEQFHLIMAHQGRKQPVGRGRIFLRAVYVCTKQVQGDFQVKGMHFKV